MPTTLRGRVDVEGWRRGLLVAEVSAKALRKVIADQVNMSASHLMTDESASYQAMGRESQSHETGNHSEREYARGSVSINLAENFFSQLTRSIDGTHHHVSKEHLHRYLGEFDFRYSTRKVTDTERMGMLVDRTAGVRVSYKRVKRTTG